MVDILIPTYNRVESLIKNLRLLQDHLEKDDLFDRYRIIISDNCSKDDTKIQVEQFKVQKNPRLDIRYFRTNENIGLEPNMVYILGKSTSDFVLWLGDDDYLDDGYLKYVVQKLDNNKNVGCIITGLSNMDKDGVLTPGRLMNFEEKYYEPGFETILEISHWGHQLSGLVLKRENLLETYLDSGNRTPYLFISFVANRLDLYASIFVPKFKTKVSVDNEKDWGYNSVGLLDEVFKCYYQFVRKYGQEKVADLMVRFVVLHSYRLGIKKSKPLRLVHQYKYLMRNSKRIKTFKRKLKLALIKDYLLALRR